VRAVLRLFRPFTLLAPVVGAASGAAVAAAVLERPLWTGGLGLALLSAVAATAASNAWNQVFDLDLDRVNKPDRPLPAGEVTRGGALWAGHLAAVLAVAAGAVVSPPFLACVGVGLLASWVYSAPPLRTKRHLAGALATIALPRGFLVPVAGWSVLAAPTRTDPWALGLVAGLFVLGAAATKDFSDVAGDRAHGCRTLPGVLGARRAAQLVAPALFVPFLLYPVFGGIGWLQAPLERLVLLALLLAGGGLAAAGLLLRSPEDLLAGGRNHPAWRGMYLLLLGSQVGTALAYAA
jgi:4-hydroxybenzoate polyprenyltransferase